MLELNLSQKLCMSNAGTIPLQEKNNNLESLINESRKYWKHSDKSSFSRYISYGVFSAYTENREKAIIWDIYPNKTKIEKGELKEILKNILFGLYFFVEEILKLGISQSDTDSTNLKMAKNLKNFCGRGIITTFERTKNLEIEQFERTPMKLEEVDFAKLDESLEIENLPKFTFQFTCQVDKSLLEYLKTKIAKLYQKELLKL